MSNICLFLYCLQLITMHVTLYQKAGGFDAKNDDKKNAKASRVSFILSLQGWWEVLELVFCRFLSWNERPLGICCCVRFVKTISLLGPFVPCANFSNEAAESCPSAQINIFIMVDTVKNCHQQAEAK